MCSDLSNGEMNRGEKSRALEFMATDWLKVQSSLLPQSLFTHSPSNSKRCHVVMAPWSTVNIWLAQLGADKRKPLFLIRLLFSFFYGALNHGESIEIQPLVIFGQGKIALCTGRLLDGGNHQDVKRKNPQLSMELDL